jgi:hypothetical protein
VAGFCKHGNEPLGFHKIRGISWLTENLSASQKKTLQHGMNLLNFEWELELHQRADERNLSESLGGFAEP